MMVTLDAVAILQVTSSVVSTNMPSPETIELEKNILNGLNMVLQTQVSKPFKNGDARHISLSRKCLKRFSRS